MALRSSRSLGATARALLPLAIALVAGCATMSSEQDTLGEASGSADSAKSHATTRVPAEGGSSDTGAEPLATVSSTTSDSATKTMTTRLPAKVGSSAVDAEQLAVEPRASAESRTLPSNVQGAAFALPPETERLGPEQLRVAAQPKLFVPGGAEPLEISFELPKSNTAVVRIRDEAGRPVRQLDVVDGGKARARARWDGRDRSGAPVPPGVYLYEIRLRDEAGRVAVYGAEAEGGGEEVMPQRLTVDPQSGRVNYVLPRAARVRLRVALRNLPLLDTPLDWYPQPAGPHEYAWDGSDASGLMDLREDPRLRVVLHAYELPRNSVIIESAQETAAEQAAAGRAAGALALSRGFRHARHTPASCHEPRFRVEFPDASGRTANGTPILDGLNTVRITLDPRDSAHLINTRFEVMFYVDTIFLFEEEEGSNPFSFRLDTLRAEIQESARWQVP